jgi:hypothetical protein
MRDNNRPLDLESLNLVLTYIPDYPATSDQLAMAAKRLYASPSVTDFFESMPSGTVFKSKADIMQRSHDIEVLMEEAETTAQEQIAEEIKSYD